MNLFLPYSATLARSVQDVRSEEVEAGICQLHNCNHNFGGSNAKNGLKPWQKLKHANFS